ncbi:MAG: hypothetical protein ACFFDV_05045 [Candidatus Thorarchaeota archaeon]
MSSEEDTKSDDMHIPKTTITIYGGKKEDVGRAITETLGLSDDDYYSTWISLGVMKRLGFLFEGGVESAGSVVGLIAMIIVLFAALALFAFFQIVVVFVVIAVLTLLSGGAAFKFLRATYITKPLSEMNLSNVEEFVRIQISQGRFVRLEDQKTSDSLSRITQSSSKATLLFRTGIQFSLLVATVFLILEVSYWFVTGHWLSGLNPVTGPAETILLVDFGFLFLCAVVLMDLGVLMRYRVSRGYSKNSQE